MKSERSKCERLLVGNASNNSEDIFIEDRNVEVHYREKDFPHKQDDARQKRKVHETKADTIKT